MSSDGPSLRLFFAAPLAEELRGRVVRLQQELAREARGLRVKWVEPENLHLTLKFVGDAPAGRVDELLAVARQVARDAAPCEIDYCTVGCFASRGCPRTIWLGAEPEPPELATLATGLEEALARAGLAEPERRPFRAHLTLGRVKDRRGGGALLEEVRRLAHTPVGAQRLDDFVLLSSELTGAGPIYTEQGRVDLAG